MTLVGVILAPISSAGPEDPEDGGQWGAIIPWPHIAVSAANLPDGKILTFSGSERDTWPAPERTYSATWNPDTGVHTELLHNGHNMFCAHLAMMADGRVFVNGGRNKANSPWVSIFDYSSGSNGQWTQIQNMASGGRWYPTTVALPDGRIFTATGDATVPRYPEIWSPTSGWQIKNGIDFNAMIFNDYGGTHAENNWWPLLHVAPNGDIFHSGPTPKMHYIDPDGNGSFQQVGPTQTAWYHKHGTAIMYDEGKILNAGGWISGTNANSTNRVFTVDLNGPSPAVVVAPTDPAQKQVMAYARKFHNGVVAPTGEVYVFGGNTSGTKFSDNGSILPIEIWNPVTRQWRTGAAMDVPRNYHSVALLMTDGRILSAGGGYCSASPTCGGASHQDAQVYTPPYLFNASGNLAARPVISGGDALIFSGQEFDVQATTGMQKFSLVKMSSTTHGINTDVRFLNVPFTEVSPGNYELQASSNPNVLTPGYWMLFALNANGVPSKAHVVRANSGTGLPWINAIGNRSTAIGSSVNLQVTAGDGDGDPITYSATGLPPGLNINSNTGLISGTVTTLGVYSVEVTVDDSDEGTADDDFLWTVFDPIVSCPDCLDFDIVTTSSYSNQDQHANVIVEDSGLTLGLADNTQRKTDFIFTITADTVLEFDFLSTDEAEINAIGFDENENINDAVRAFQLYGTQNWNNADHNFDNYAGAGQIHYVIPVGQFYTGSNMRMIFLNDNDAGSGLGSNGKFRNVRVLTDGNGNFPPSIVNPGAQAGIEGDPVNLAIVATDPNIGNALSFSANGSLPSGLAISSGGQITGTPTTPGNYNVTITVDDGNGGTADAPFAWSICSDETGCGTGDYLDFNVIATTSYSNQDDQGNVSVQDGGTTIALADNTQRRTVQTFTVTPETILEFDYESTAEPEIGGIGFDNNNNHNDAATVFALHGTQNWNGDIDAFNNYAGGGPQHYVIPVGEYYTGPAMYLVFVNDYDAGTGIGTNSRFSNVRIYEPGAGGLATLIDPVPAASGSTTNLAITPNFVGLEFNWNFGDNTGDTGFGPDATVEHTFSGPGLYVVTVTVRDPSTSEETVYTFTQLVHAPLTANKPSISTGIAVHPTQSQVWNVNPDNDSVTVINTVTNTVTAEVPVGDHPVALGFAPDGTAWVVNHGTASISIIDSASLTVTATLMLDHSSQPYGVAFSPTAAEAFVTLEAIGDLVKFDANLRIETGRTYVGPTPRHLSVSADGLKVYVSRFVTPQLPDEHTAAPIVENAGQYFGGEVVELNATTLAQQDLVVLRWSTDLASEHDGPGVPNYLGPPVISPDGLGAWVPSKQDNILAGGVRGGTGMSFDQTVRAVSSKIDLVAGDEIIAARIDHDNASVANYAAFGPYGAYLYTTLEGNREVAISNAYTGIEIQRFDVGRAPQGITISPDGNTLYVNNFMDRTVGVYDISAITQRNILDVIPLATVSTVATEALPAQVFLGKQLFYDARDPRLSAGPYMSCASCHNDGGSDGRTWDFTNMGEGLRATVSLEGRAGTGHGLLHWSANFDEVQDFEGQIRNFAGGTGLMLDTDFFSGTRFHPLGDPKSGLSSDLDALAAYVSSLNRVPSSPYRNPDGTLSTQGEAGKLVFESEGCTDCHAPATYTDSALPDPNLHDIGTLTPASGKRLGGTLTGIDTPTLLGVWSTAPYLHDGSAFDLTEAIAAHSGISLTAQELEDVAVFLQELDDVTGNDCGDCLNFNVVTTNAYSNQDQHGNVAVENAGLSLAVADNTQRKSLRTFNVTVNTVLEFDFESTSEGEVQGIGFDEDNNFNNGVRVFKVYGTQNWNGANSDFDNYTGGIVHYSIPVGQYYTGSAMHLVISNDDDAGGGLGSNARFSNVRIVTSGDGNIAPTIAAVAPQTTTQFDSVNMTLQAEDPNIGDLLSFSSGGSLPPGLSISSSGVITGNTDVTGDYTVTITVSDGNGGIAQTTFQWAVCNGETGCGASGYLDFTTLPTVSYSSQDNHGNVSVLDGGATILLADNTQRRTTQTFSINVNTVLEFDYSSTDEPEIGGIGFDENNNYSDAPRVFKVFGNQNWNGVISAFDDYVLGAPKHYVIPVGQYYTGAAMYLVFMNDDDAGTGLGSNSRFTNVRIHDVVP